MKYWSLLIVFGLFSGPLISDEVSNPSEDVLVVEMNRFGFRGDWTWYLFEKPMRESFEEAGIPFELEFRKFPVKDYKGKPALELALNYWRRTLDGRWEINFWATYVDQEGQETELDIVFADEFGLDINSFMTDAVIRDTARIASLELAERLKQVL